MECTCPEIQRQHTPLAYKYQPSNGSRQPAATQLMVDINYHPADTRTWFIVDINHQPDALWLTFDENIFLIYRQNNKIRPKSVKTILFWNVHALQHKENTFLQYMNINYQPAVTLVDSFKKELSMIYFILISCLN